MECLNNAIDRDEETSEIKIVGNRYPVMLMTYYCYAQKHHNNYNMCYKNYPMKVGERNIAKTKVIVVDNTPQ